MPKTTKTTEYNLGGDFTLDDLESFIKDAKAAGWAGTTKPHINAGDAQRDGAWCIITLRETS